MSKEKQLTKGEFLVIYNTANFLSQRAFNKLGLISKRFTKIYADVYADLADEEYYIRSEFAQREGDTIKKDQNQSPIVKADKEKEQMAKLKIWKAEPLGVELDKHEVFKPEFINNQKAVDAIKEKTKNETGGIANSDVFIMVQNDAKMFMISPDIYEVLNGYVFELDENIYLAIIENGSKETSK